LYDHPPLWVSHGAGSRFWDLDGHEYVDLYVADMSAFCGHAPAPVVRAVCERMEADGQLAAGLRAQIDRAGLPWSVNAHGSHAFYLFSPQPPCDARGARDTDRPGLRALIRLFRANRGVWESCWWLGPTVSVAHAPQDVQAYLDAIGEFTQALA
jgi:glutamate-1-semialdehyde aminotransferase